MQYRSFQIKHFKGIKDTRIDLSAENRIVTLVGLNESGKTTLLEAIHSFSPDKENRAIYSDQPDFSKNYASLIPKHSISDFTGRITVMATVALQSLDKIAIAEHAHNTLGFTIQESSLPNTFTIDRVLEFNKSERTRTVNEWGINFKILIKGKRKPIDISADDQRWQSIVQFMRTLLPTIAYFPTFVFDFPDKIYLSGHDSDPKTIFYRKVFQDILDFQGENLKIEDHIVARVRKGDIPTTPLEFLASIFGGNSSVKQQIDAVMFKASAAVSRVIFDKWNEIFHDKSSKKEIIIEWQPELEGSEKNIYIQFFIKDGVNKYAVSERSLGFRWFFCFLLFTQLRASRKDRDLGTIFLFDEPASNLHSRAQEQLLESFPRIATGRNFLIYSTHSHYMINPHWLEQTYIVDNKAIKYDQDAFASPPHSGTTEIVATRYRRFVGENPDKPTYFQPILDKLDFAPSKMDFPTRVVLVEGKSDFYLLSYFELVKKRRADRIFIPSAGANDLGPLIALYLGWGRHFIIMLDGDKSGVQAKARYIEEFGLSSSHIILCPEASGDAKIIEIEDVLDDSDDALVAGHFGIKKKPTKRNVMRFFQEMLASKTDVPLSANCLARLEAITAVLRSRIEP